jgi:hypothetical protein
MALKNKKKKEKENLPPLDSESEQFVQVMMLDGFDYSASRDKITSKDGLARFDDLYTVAQARKSMEKSIEYWTMDKKGHPITLLTTQRFMIRFIQLAWKYGLIPIVNMPMGTGKSTIAVSLIGCELGRDQNLRTQIVCSADLPAQDRGSALGRILTSSRYRKVYPQIEKDDSKSWNKHELNVKRLGYLDGEDIFEDDATEPGAINASVTLFGVGSAALGSRSERTIWDDIPTYENAIKAPTDGQHIHETLKLKWLSRRDSPIGMSDKNYSVDKDPFRGVFINTPWHEKDCVMLLRWYPKYATCIVGVNQQFTGYNCEIWNLPDEAIEQLRAEFAMCECGHGHHDHYDNECFHRDENKLRDCECTTHVEVPGEPVEERRPAKAVLTLPLTRPSSWYQEQYTSGEREFDQQYRCKVYSDSEKAYPMMHKSLDSTIEVNWEPIFLKRSGGSERTGHRSWIDNAPKGYKYCAVDLSTIARAGTIFTIGVMLPNSKRVILEIRKGKWSGDEVVDVMDQIFKDHDDIITMFVEDAGQQKMWIELLLKFKLEYPWWYRVQKFQTDRVNKNDEQIGVLSMAQPLAAALFVIGNSVDQEKHPQPGVAGYKDGCECGHCCLINDLRGQMRGVPVKSDSIMSFWMLHRGMPPTAIPDKGGAPTGVTYTKTAQERLSRPKQAAPSSWLGHRKTDDKHANVHREMSDQSSLNGVTRAELKRRAEEELERRTAALAEADAENTISKWKPKIKAETPPAPESPRSSWKTLGRKTF